MVSVIVPVYNVEKFLGRCLKSIVEQSFEDLEIILVDDGSEDKSGDICDEYARKDARVKVIHTVNRGVSSARNKGLDVASGEYVYFVDADDMISKNAIAILVDLIDGYEMSFTGHIVYDIDGDEETRWHDDECQPHVWSRDDALMLMFDCTALAGFEQKYCYVGYCFNKLFRRDIIEINRLRFDEKIYYNEDRLFVVSYLTKCRNIISSNLITYKYMNRKTGHKSLFRCDNFLHEKTEFDAFDLMIRMQTDINIRMACVFNAYKRAVRFYLKNAKSDYRVKSSIKALMRKYGRLMLKNEKYFRLQYLIIAKIL